MTKHSLTQLFWVMSMYLKTYMLTAKHKKLLRNVPEFTVVKNPGHGMIRFSFHNKSPTGSETHIKNNNNVFIYYTGLTYYYTFIFAYTVNSIIFVLLLKCILNVLKLRLFICTFSEFKGKISQTMFHISLLNP